VRRSEVDVVLAFALDRLSRKQAHVAILADEIAEAGVTLEFVTERFEDTAVGEFIRSAKAFAAEIEREKLAERTVRGRIARVQSGKLIPGGRPPYGYRWRDETKGQLDEDPITGAVVRRMFAAIAAGASLNKLAATLAAEHIPTPTGQGHWHASTLSTILHRPAYKGEAYGWGIRKAGSTPQRFDPQKAIRLPDGTIPALVDQATWDAVQDVLRRNKAQSIRSAKNPAAALLRGGFVTCGTCGRAMKVRPRSGGGVDYYCDPNRGLPCPQPTAIKGNILDAAVWARARAIITDPSTVAREIERLRDNDPTADDLKSIARLVDEVERQRNNLSGAIAMLDDPDAAAPLVAQLRTLAERRRALEAELETLQQRQASWQAAQADLDNLARWCTTVANRVDDLDWEQRRIALNALAFSVKVFPKNHDPRYVITADIDLQPVSNTT
jgi:site-specific DNA recombinase